MTATRPPAPAPTTAARPGRSSRTAGCRASAPPALFARRARRRRACLGRSPASTSSLAVALRRRARHRSRCTSAPARVEGRAQGDRPAGDLRWSRRLRCSPWCRWSRWSGRCSAAASPRLDGEFFNSSMLGVVGEGGGAYHAIVGTLIITGLTALISVPIGLLTAIYLVEYGRGRLEAGDHVPRRRDDRHPVDRRRPVRLRPVRDLLRPRASGWARRRGRAVGADDPGRRAVGRGGAQARARTSCARPPTPWACRSGAPIVKVVLPTAIAGLATGVTLAIARVIGETAPLLVTVGITNAHQPRPVRRADGDAAGVRLLPAHAARRSRRSTRSTGPGRRPWSSSSWSWRSTSSPA